MNIILQEENTECGHASLLMILSYYGCHLDLNSYRNEIKISPEGASFHDLIQIADSFGLDATAYAVKQKDIDEINLPAILQIQGEHFVVIEKIDKNFIYIIDPAIGRRRLNRLTLFELIGVEQLCYVLEFEINETFQKFENTNKIGIIDIINSIKGIRKHYFLIFMFSVILQVIVLLTPLYVQVVMDKVIVNNNIQLLTILLIGFIILYLFDVTVSYVRESMFIYFEKTIIKSFSINIFTKLISLPESFFKNRTAAALVNKFDTIEVIVKNITRTVAMIFIDFFMIISLIIVMFLLNIKLTLIIFLIMSINIIFYYFHYSIKRRLVSEFWHKKGNKVSSLLTSINNIKTLKLYTLEKHAYSDYAVKTSEYIAINKKIDRLSNIFDHLGRGLVHIDTLIVIYIGTMIVLDNQLSIGMLYSFIFYKTVFTSSFLSFLDKLVNIRVLQSDIDNIKDILLTEKENVLPTKINKILLSCHNRKIYSLTGKIEFKDFSCYYKSENLAVFKNFNFCINESQSCCIIGKSGSGKTTILNSLVGLHTVEKGNIFIDGIDITQIPTNYLRKNISYMTTEQDFFNESIVKNIAIGAQKVDIERIILILKALDLYDYIANELSGGLASYIGDINHRFSTGQKQRLLLARAIYKKSEILLLDEPTSALDPTTEEKVMEYLVSLNRRIIIVTHRQSVAKYFNCVVDLDMKMVEHV